MARVEVRSNVGGMVRGIEAKAGDKVKEGDTLIVLDSMKVEIPVAAPAAGTLSEIMVEPDGLVEEDQLVAVIES